MSKKKSPDGKTSPHLQPRDGLLEQLVSSPDSVSPRDAARAAETVIELVCSGSLEVAAEIAVLEQLMDAWQSSAPDALEPQIVISDLVEEWHRNGLQALGQPEDWWWLASPCSITHSWGAFRVRSWLLHKASQG